ncbi:hypothetical protein A7J09_10975 [Streptococcus suis]|nr:hypothetical protein A7J09_10750 [Streptococcus suis]KPA69130.1 hypothetical protein XK26_03020 [Streptococcus suis]
MDLKVQGRFTPKGSHTCNWLKPKQLRLFFPEFLVRTQLRLRYEGVKQLLDKIGKRSRLLCNQ